MPVMILTCETDGCQNSGIPLELETDSPNFMCGACMTAITNAVEKTNGSTETAE